MEFFDVVFPLNIGPLTYSWSPSRGPLKPGMLVKAEVKRSIQHGIVLGKALERPPGFLKEIDSAVLNKPVLSGVLLELLKWMARYYLAPEGVVLKSMSVVELFRTTGGERRRKAGAFAEPPAALELPPLSREILSPVRDSLEKGYRTFLFHAPTTLHEVSYVLEIMRGLRNVIILVPETNQIDLVSPVFRESVRERLVVLHGRLSKAERRKAVRKLLSGESDIVLGTRPAVFVPLPSVSLIAVLQEQSLSYKNPEGARYHARDVAVMRGYLEKCTVVLSSPSPSMESFYNTEKGKYFVLRPADGNPRPKVEVIDMRKSRAATPYLSGKVIQAATACIKEKEGILFLINRKGYSMIQCAECGDIRSCPECGIPLVYHKDKMMLRCHYCGGNARPADICLKCGGTKLELVGAGTQRIAAEVKRLLGGEVIRFDRDSVRDDPHLKGLAESARGEEIIVGTKALTGRIRGRASFRLCVFVNPDLKLHIPDFRSSELLLQEIWGMSEQVKPGGLLILQTKMPSNEVFRCIKKYDFVGFARTELSLRKSLDYPPFSRMIAITVSSKDHRTDAVVKALPSAREKIEIIGPMELPAERHRLLKVLLKATAKERVHHYAREFLNNLRDEKGLRITVDVDPISL